MLTSLAAQLAKLLIYCVLTWEHALVQNSGNQNPTGFLAIKQNVPPALHPSQSGADILTLSAEPRIAGQSPAAVLNLVQISKGLILAPGL